MIGTFGFVFFQRILGELVGLQVFSNLVDSEEVGVKEVLD